MTPEDAEAAWRAEADRVLAAVLAESRVRPTAPGSQTGSGLQADAAEWLVGLALRCDDRAYVEAWCLRLGRGLPSGHPLLGLSALCVGHLSHRFGRLSDDARAMVEELAARSRRDPADVDGNAISGLEDVEFFMPRHPMCARFVRRVRSVSFWIRWTCSRS